MAAGHRRAEGAPPTPTVLRAEGDEVMALLGRPRLGDFDRSAVARCGEEM